MTTWNIRKWTDRCPNTKQFQISIEMRLRVIREDPAFSQAIAYLAGPGEMTCLLAEARPGVLHGTPFFAKDLFDIKGWPTTASSTFLQVLRGPVKRTAELVKKLESAGAFCLGKTHLNEFAYGLSGENAHFGDCPHPDDPSCLSGGSSSGSAFAVAKGWVPFALGTDTGGSIRVPASFCGVWGLRYYPRFLVEGCFPLAPSFDTVGFFTNSIEQLALVHGVLVPEFQCAEKQTGFEVGVLFQPGWCETREVAGHYKAVFSKRGHKVNPVLSEEMGRWMKDLVPAYSVLQSLEALRVHENWIDAWKHAYDPATYHRIERARHWSDQEVRDAKRTCDGFRKWMSGVMEEFPCLVMPAVPCSSPVKAGLTESFRNKLLSLTTPASIAGLPTLTEPFTPRGAAKSLGLQYMCSGMKELNEVVRRLAS